jgi:hypothetical protein
MMHLLAIFYDHQLERYGYNVLLRPIVEDFKKLEAGVNMCINGKNEIIRGTLTAIVADNLACHSVAGLKAAFGHKVFRKCRFFLATEDQIQSLYSYIHFIRRTQSDHEEYCNALLQESIAEHISMVYGVKFNSILNELSYFNVTYGCPPDIMHDLLEGVVPLTVSLLLVYCIKKKKYFSRIQLNNMIKNFNYGYTEAVDKPCTVSRIQLKK